MGGPQHPDDDHGRDWLPPSPYRSTGPSARDAARPAHSPPAARATPSRRRGSGSKAEFTNPFARLAAAWRRFRERPGSPQIIAGTLLAAALLCGALGLLMHPSTASGDYTLPHSATGGLVGTAGATSGTNRTPGSILAPTATLP